MQNRRRADNIVPTMIVKVAIGNIVSQNNQQNALSSGLGGVSLQTYNYDAMNRLIHSSGGNSDAGVSYHFSQTYSPSGRIGDKFCDFTSQNDGFYYDASGYQMHALRKTIDGTSGAPCDFVYDENGNMQGYSVKEGAFVSYNIWNAANQMVATGNTRACGYYGYGYDGKRRYKLTGKTAVMSANGGDVVMDFSFDDYVLYPNSFITGTPKGYTKHYYAGSERIASRLMNCWHFNKALDQYMYDSEQQLSEAIELSNEQFDFTFNERLRFMNYYVPQSLSDIEGNTIANNSVFPELHLAGYYKKQDIVYDNYEMLADNYCKSYLFFTHSDHLGSSSWTTDENGYAIQHIEYLPFGEEFVNQRTTSYEDRYTFTGKELDAESNLYYYDARYNSSTYSQFNSPDPMSDKYPDKNPFLYCSGNPIMRIDPDGRADYYDENGTHLGNDGINDRKVYQQSTDGNIRFRIYATPFSYVGEVDRIELEYTGNMETNNNISTGSLSIIQYVGKNKYTRASFSAISGSRRKGGGYNHTLPNGIYDSSNFRERRDNAAMIKDGIGFSINLSDIGNRSKLRIHPDGGTARGTEGCIGLTSEKIDLERFVFLVEPLYNQYENIIVIVNIFGNPNYYKP